MDWQKLDIWPRGKAGFDARYRYTDLEDETGNGGGE
jgi:hypothetical protein